jgi:hypothetical protein
VVVVKQGDWLEPSGWALDLIRISLARFRSLDESVMLR